mmetsp:Transcript_68333/g.165281  ORF Transcript_68333/g.165281 Transcript_68333/m.165281 type:complete len:223 (-) Transcript_68333:1919-2587(-)
MALVARLSASFTAAFTLSFHSASAPAALPSMTPCHLSGMRMGPLALMSCVRVSPLLLSCLAAAESPCRSKRPWLPRSSSIVLSTFILWFDIRSNLSSVSRSGGTDSGPLTATMTSSTSPRSFIVGPSCDGAWPSKCGIAACSARPRPGAAAASHRHRPARAGSGPWPAPRAHSRTPPTSAPTPEAHARRQAPASSAPTSLCGTVRWVAPGAGSCRCLRGWLC